MRKNNWGLVGFPRKNWEYLVIYFSSDPTEEMVQRLEAQFEPRQPQPIHPEIIESYVVQYLEDNSLIYPDSDDGREAVIREIKAGRVLRVDEVRAINNGFEIGKELYRHKPTQRQEKRGFGR